MAVWECAECTAQYAVGAPKCPQCGSKVRVNEAARAPEEEQMAKVTVHGGASDATADEDVPAGNSSSSSPETEPGSPEPDYDGMTLAELRDAATARDLPSSGNKATLIERLRET